MNNKFILSLREVILNNFAWILLILITIFAKLIDLPFLNYDNIVNLLLTSTTLGFLAIGESIVLITGNFDISLENNMLVCACIAGWLISPHFAASGLLLNPILVVVLMILLGGAIAAISGFLVAYVGMHSLITTLGLYIFLLGIAVSITKGRFIYPLNDTFNYLGKTKVYNSFPVSIFLLIIVIIIFSYILRYTTFGRSLYAIGSNKYAAINAGINVKLYTMFAYIIAGMFAAIAGWILAGRLNSVGPLMSSGLLFIVFAAAVIGGASLHGGKGNPISVYGGVLLILSINNLMNLAKIDMFLIEATTGLIILGAIFIDNMKNIRKLYTL